MSLLQLGHGDFSSASTKVLRMVNTLGVDSEAKQTIEALQSELQKTKDKLKAVEELNNQSGINFFLCMFSFSRFMCPFVLCLELSFFMPSG